MGSIYHTVRVKKRPGKTRSAKVRPKTFKSEEAAKKWAKEQGITTFTLENLRAESATEPKIRVVVSE